jgi:hypothetical protein
MPGPAAAKRPYRIDPAVARERASRAARVRNSPDTYISQLERAELTDEQKRRIAALLMPLLGAQPAAAAAGAR